MRLLRIELTRLRWRRAVLLLAALSILLPALIWAGMAWGTRPVSDSQMAEAERQVQLQQEGMQEMLDDCRANPDNFGVQDTDDLEQACGEVFGEPEVGWFLMREPLTLANARDHSSGVATVLIGLALLIGATFAGADWSSGSMSNQLLFEPRRLRVWLAKGAAVLLGAGALAALGLATFWALTVGVIESRDITVSSAQWRDAAEAAGRSTLLGGAAGLGGFVVTMLLRSTVGTLGVMLAVSIGGSLLVAALPFDGTGRWMLQNNVFGILDNGYGYYDQSLASCDQYGEGGGTCQATLSLGEGVRFFGVLLLVGVALSMGSFRRRDVP
jgi:ABC-2 type transport system permease protein